MSDQSVLYDVPGPRAVRRQRIGTAAALVLIAGLVAVAIQRLASRGQFDSDLWSPWVNPSDDSFAQVWELVGRGALNTILAAAMAITLSLLVGVVLGVARMMSGRMGRIPVVGFIELFRGLPVVITIVFVWRAMAELDVPIDVLPGEPALWYLVIGLTLYNSVIVAEILRAGVASLPRGQGEAGRAIGMTEGQVMRSILLPQAFRTMLPALISQLVVVLKDTSLAAVIGLGYFELLRRGNQISQVLDNPIQSLFIVGAIFVVINYGLSRLAVYVERRMSTSSYSDPSPEVGEVTLGAQAHGGAGGV
ncbi:amino acid ABC transporter permease [Nocardioides marinus]|jgi:glutamate transport system permease protein|uniref:Glutamate transport system permease protein n=1 Tax=Nocardioides marinus TaxID=374514 RepID=A0A7Y9YBR7_9ACTN|nr:amino acid ABC transporter permease [Nocardioides marinus]MAO80011.1 polar amino acid ABC transporter permease [Nocardioides sp.]MBU2075105.1 amino acid ABC transporter permease [Actinomycetota bacterium]NYI08954.1 glutamate transport system permease protein [Nocardioides marinus]